MILKTGTIIAKDNISKKIQKKTKVDSSNNLFFSVSENRNNIFLKFFTNINYLKMWIIYILFRIAKFLYLHKVFKLWTLFSLSKHAKALLSWLPLLGLAGSCCPTWLLSAKARGRDRQAGRRSKPTGGTGPSTRRTGKTITLGHNPRQSTILI